MYIVSYVGLFLGLIILALLLTWSGIGDVLDLLLLSGWKLLLLPVAWSPALFASAWAWRVLFDENASPSFRNIFIANWMGRAINTLLPVATIGGEVAKARLITLWGCKGTHATSTVLVDKTVQALSLIPWGIIGIILLIFLSNDDRLVIPALIGFSVLGLGILGFILVQRAGMFGNISNLMTRFSRSDNWPDISGHAREIDQQVVDLYNNPGKVIYAILIKTSSLMLETTEIWLACYFLGQPIGIIEALMLKSLVSSINNIAFVIPNSYGVQEGGFLLIGALLGFTPDFALALSLATRIREICIDLPGLISWQLVESKRFIHKKRIHSES